MTGPERKQQIIQAAITIMAEHGLHGTTTRRIAEEVGVSEPALYKYFPGKKELLLEALADCLAWIKLPCVEVHLSNLAARTDDPLRQRSFVGRHSIGVIAGFGILGYGLAVQALWQRLRGKG
jgi:AcrR family transcriptional regulator